VWLLFDFPVPALDDLPESVRESVLDPLIPAKVDHIAREERGLLWTYMQGWTQLYGVVTLEVFGHLDPRIIESGEMFVDTLLAFAPRLGLTAELPRLERLIRDRIGS
jgi:hypothetical protein